MDRYRRLETGANASALLIVTCILISGCQDEVFMGLDRDLEELIHGDPIELPFYVDDYYVPSYHNGQDQYVTYSPCSSGVDQLPDGHCGEFVYSPLEASFYCTHLLFPQDNWGQFPGLPVAQGATAVQFTTWVSTGWAYIEFFSGGTGSDYWDTFNVEDTFVVTDIPTTYLLNLESCAYERVIGALAWRIMFLEPPENDELVLYVDNVEWTSEDVVCQTPGSNCPWGAGWPSACTYGYGTQGALCGDGQECVHYMEDSSSLGICVLPCDPDDDICPYTEWGLEGQCFSETLLSETPTDMCFATGCETTDECPIGMLCMGYANCPDLHTCMDSSDPDCESIPECDDAPIEGKLCYPDNY